MSETNPGLRTAIVGLTSAAIGVIGTIVVGSFGYFNRDRELDIQMVNVGLSVLKGDAPLDYEKSKYARLFAIRLLEKYSEVPIEDADNWAKEGNTPFQSLSPNNIADMSLETAGQIVEERILRLVERVDDQGCVDWDENYSRVFQMRAKLSAFDQMKAIETRILTSANELDVDSREACYRVYDDFISELSSDIPIPNNFTDIEYFYRPVAN